MWKILHNFSRALRQHLHSPRTSAGLYVDEEPEVHELAEKRDKFCPISWMKKSSQDVCEKPICSAQVLNSLHIQNQNEGIEGNYQCGNTGRKDKREWWQSCHKDFWHIMRQTEHMVEAISLGTAILWGTDKDRLRRKSVLLYRLIFSVPGNHSSLKNVIADSITTASTTILGPKFSNGLLAIKDASGAAHDAVINKSKSETLDSALEEFQTMCDEYKALNESYLGLQAKGRGDMTSAVEHLRTSCLLGNSSACFNLGLCYETGDGVEQDSDTAEHYYKMAAKRGNRLALYNLGLMYLDQQLEDEHSDCSCPSRQKEGISLMEKAAWLGLAEAQTYLGIHHFQENQDPAKAVPYFKAAADQNDTEAQYFLAICYEQGWGVQVNECRAAQLYSLAANAGHETALYNLAVFTEHGLGGLPENLNGAIDLYKKAAEMGSEQAKIRLDEITLSNARAHEQKEKSKAVQHLQFNDHSNELSLSHHNVSLSPSVSSPNLTDYFHTNLFGFFSKNPSDNNWHSEHGRSLDQGGNANFHLDFVGDDSHTKSRELKPSFGSVQDEMLSPRTLHRSHTFPNMALIAC
ncbi:unnamed protein product [Lymnaea stagnalis]|uniref:Uncharacterized protein n=1 Tax=Lymnaea stagnalis TaxID=6523 RepID=A0AAV2HXG4_LYMST